MAQAAWQPGQQIPQAWAVLQPAPTVELPHPNAGGVPIAPHPDSYHFWTTNAGYKLSTRDGLSHMHFTMVKTEVLGLHNAAIFDVPYSMRRFLMGAFRLYPHSTNPFLCVADRRRLTPSQLRKLKRLFHEVRPWEVEGYCPPTLVHVVVPRGRKPEAIRAGIRRYSGGNYYDLRNTRVEGQVRAFPLNKTREQASALRMEVQEMGLAGWGAPLSHAPSVVRATGAARVHVLSHNQWVLKEARAKELTDKYQNLLGEAANAPKGYDASGDPDYDDPDNLHDDEGVPSDSSHWNGEHGVLGAMPTTNPPVFDAFGDTPMNEWVLLPIGSPNGIVVNPGDPNSRRVTPRLVPLKLKQKRYVAMSYHWRFSDFRFAFLSYFLKQFESDDNWIIRIPLPNQTNKNGEALEDEPFYGGLWESFFSKSTGKFKGGYMRKTVPPDLINDFHDLFLFAGYNVTFDSGTGRWKSATSISFMLHQALSTDVFLDPFKDLAHWLTPMFHFDPRYPLRVYLSQTTRQLLHCENLANQICAMTNVAGYGLQAARFGFTNAEAIEGGAGNNRCICGHNCRFGNKDPERGVAQSVQGGEQGLELKNRRMGRSFNP